MNDKLKPELMIVEIQPEKDKEEDLFSNQYHSYQKLNEKIDAILQRIRERKLKKLGS